MCIIIAAQEPELIEESILDTCWDNNPDGAGLAYVKNNKIIVAKELSSKDKFLRLFAKHAKEATKEQSPMMIHFRIGTSGSRTIKNVHPFWVSKNTVMCHNGVLHKIKPQEDRSDTNTFAFFVLRKLRDRVMDPVAQFFIEDYIGEKNKLAFLSTSKKLLITNRKAGVEVPELKAWFSNRSHESKKKCSLLRNTNHWTKQHGFCWDKDEPTAGTTNLAAWKEEPTQKLLKKLAIRCKFCRIDVKPAEREWFISGFGDIMCSTCGDLVVTEAARERKKAEAIDLDDTQEIPRSLQLVAR